MSQTFKATDGTSLGYAIHGDHGPWLVLCHALLATSAQWAPQIPELSKRFRVVCIDTRGHGASEASAPPYDLSLLVDDLEQVFDYLSIDKAYLLGASMNGLVVQKFAATYSERVERLVLANTTWVYGPETDAGWDKRIEAAKAGQFPAVVGGTLERFLTRAFRDAKRASLNTLESAMLSVKIPGFIGCCNALKGADISDVHQAIKAPTLLVAGESDIATTPDVMRALKERIAGSDLIVLPGAHLCNFENPQAFTAAISAFLK